MFHRLRKIHGNMLLHEAGAFNKLLIFNEENRDDFCTDGLDIGRLVLSMIPNTKLKEIMYRLLSANGMMLLFLLTKQKH